MLNNSLRKRKKLIKGNKGEKNESEIRQNYHSEL